MIVVNGVLESTEADIQAMKSAVAEMEVASQAEEGCHDYTFSVELNNPTVIRITECWESMDALMAHFQTPHMATFQAAIGSNPPTSMDITFYEAEAIPSPFA